MLHGKGKRNDGEREEKKKSMRTYGRVKEGRGGKEKNWWNMEGGNAT